MIYIIKDGFHQVIDLSSLAGDIFWTHSVDQESDLYFVPLRKGVEDSGGLKENILKVLSEKMDGVLWRKKTTLMIGKRRLDNIPELMIHLGIEDATEVQDGTFGGIKVILKEAKRIGGKLLPFQFDFCQIDVLSLREEEIPVIIEAVEVFTVEKIPPRDDPWRQRYGAPAPPCHYIDVTCTYTPIPYDLQIRINKVHIVRTIKQFKSGKTVYRGILGGKTIPEIWKMEFIFL